MLRELKRVFKDSMVYGLGSVLPKVVGILLVPMYTRFLSPTDFGVMSLAAPLAAMYGQLLLLGMAGSIFRLYRVGADRDSDAAGSLLYTVVLVDMVFGVVITAGMLAVGPSLVEALPLGRSVPFEPFLTVAFAGAFIGGPIVLLQAVLRSRGKATTHTSIALVSFALNAAFSVYFVAVARQGALGGLKGTAFAAGIMGPYALWKLSRLMKPRFSWPHLSEALAFGLPLVPHQVAGWVLGSADRYILERFRPTAEVGVYSLAYSVGMGMSIIAMAVNQAWTPTYYDLADEPDGPRKLKRLTTVYAAVITLLGVAFLLVSQELTRMLAAPAFWEAAAIAPIVVAGYYLQAMYFVTSTPVFYSKRTGLAAAVTGAAALVNLAANFVLVPRWGMYAAAWVTVGTFAMMAVSMWYASSRIRPGSFEHGRLLILTAVFAFALGGERVVAGAELQGPVSLLLKGVIFLAVVASLFVFRVIARHEVTRALSLIDERIQAVRRRSEEDE